MLTFVCDSYFDGEKAVILPYHRLKTDKMKAMGNALPKREVAKVPEPTLRRLPWYLSNVKLLKQKGERFVSSTQISKETGHRRIADCQRLVVCQHSGRTRVGYEVDTLIAVLEDFLGFTNIHKAFLFGVGSLGGAFVARLRLGAFRAGDCGGVRCQSGVGRYPLNGIPIFHPDEFERKREEYDVRIGVLTVPIEIAQRITDKMVREVSRQSGILPRSAFACPSVS